VNLIVAARINVQVPDELLPRADYVCQAEK
jgi:hypothetical protein